MCSFYSVMGPFSEFDIMRMKWNGMKGQGHVKTWREWGLHFFGDIPQNESLVFPKKIYLHVHWYTFKIMQVEPTSTGMLFNLNLNGQVD